MTPKYVKFNGVQSNSTDLGLVVQTPPTYQYPARSVEKTQIPGRNGSLVIDNNNYANVTRQYSFAKILGDNQTYVDMSAEILSWLQSGEGKYCRLEDEYDPDVYRMAMYDESNSFVNYFDGAVSVTANFECKPQRFLKTGENNYQHGNTSFPITIADDATYLQIVNSTKYAALPLLKFKVASGTTEGIMTQGSIKIINSLDGSSSWSTIAYITLNSISGLIPDAWKVIGNNTWLYIDSDKKECYISLESSTLTADDIDVSDYINFNGYDFPVLKAGYTRFSFGNPSEVDYTVSSYNTVVAAAQKHCKSAYMPKSKLEELNQHMLNLPAYSSVIEKFKVTNAAASFYQHLEDVANKKIPVTNTSTGEVTGYKSYNYTLTSPTSLLETYRKAYTFDGTSTTVPDDGPNITVSVSNNTVTINSGYTSGNNVFFMTSESNVIKTYNGGTKIYSGSTSKNITIYELATLNPSETPTLNLYHEKLPNFITEEYVYDGSGSDRTVTGYKILAVNQGYYYQDKTKIFGSASWQYRSSTSSSTVLELTWKKSKKGFMPSVNTSFLTTKTEYDIMYVAAELSYYTYKFDDVDTVFQVKQINAGTTPTSIGITTINKGWYRVTVGDTVINGSNTYLGWAYLNAGAVIFNSSSPLSISLTSTFTVEYIAADSNTDYPTYKDYYESLLTRNVDETDLEFTQRSDWYKMFHKRLADTNPAAGIPFTGTAGNALAITLASDSSDPSFESLIRFKKVGEDIVSYVAWSTKQAGSAYTLSDETVSPNQIVKMDDSFYLATIKTEPVSYDNDRAYYFIDGDATEETLHAYPPDWLKTTITTTTDDDGEEKDIIKYYSRLPIDVYLSEEYITPPSPTIGGSIASDYFAEEDGGAPPIDPVADCAYLYHNTTANKTQLYYCKETTVGSTTTKNYVLIVDDSELEEASTWYKYKWGTAIAWQDKGDTVLLATDDNTNDLDLYCLYSIPEITVPSLTNYIDFIINEDSDGNFTDIQYIIKLGGNGLNYRINYQTYWKVYNTGDELHDATTDESVIVKIIAKDTNMLQNRDEPTVGRFGRKDLIIKPNWWKL